MGVFAEPPETVHLASSTPLPPSERAGAVLTPRPFDRPVWPTSTGRPGITKSDTAGEILVGGPVADNAIPITRIFHYCAGWYILRVRQGGGERVVLAAAVTARGRSLPTTRERDESEP